MQAFAAHFYRGGLQVAQVPVSRTNSGAPSEAYHQVKVHVLVACLVILLCVRDVSILLNGIGHLFGDYLYFCPLVEVVDRERWLAAKFVYGVTVRA